MITDVQVEAALGRLRGFANWGDDVVAKGHIRLALEAAEKAAWQDIKSAPTLDRVFVSGWQERSGTVAGYWWVHEDVTDEKGVPMDHPTAKKWRPLPLPLRRIEP